jgi:hypothetical protein
MTSATRIRVMKVDSKAWGVLWHAENRLDGITEYLCRNEDTHLPALFLTRAEAREYISQRYGYIKARPDLRAEPHGWSIPRAVRVEIKPEETP